MLGQAPILQPNDVGDNPGGTLAQPRVRSLWPGVCTPAAAFSPKGEAMRAIVIERFGGPDNLVYQELPEPEPKVGHVVIEIKAFGLNHAEMHMRRGEWAEAAKVSGIECVGLVKACPGGEFPVGAKVAALMGGTVRGR